MTEKQKTILVTFAGRRDRMELLTRYVDVAIQRGLIDEWHVWDFTRNGADADWLRERFPVAQATPNNSLEYFQLPRRVSAGAEKLTFGVRATNDVHIGLRRVSGAGPSYEIVLGGWNNMASAIRIFADPTLLFDVAARGEGGEPSIVENTPGLLPEFGFSNIEIGMGDTGLEVFVERERLLHHEEGVMPGEFDIYYRAGFGSNADWRFPDFETHPERLFVVGPEAYFPKDTMFYNRAYQYYNANRDESCNDVILKCDDDIVFIDIDRLEGFIEFRRAHEEYFLISANVINNGVCAHFQQLNGMIPLSGGVFELPPGGFCGSLWANGAKAESLHDMFMDKISDFTSNQLQQIVWNERISINFIALLGRDFAHIPDFMLDDEHDLCYGVRKRAQKQNCIYSPFVASHLSFWRQDASMNVSRMIKNYGELALSRLG